MITKDNYYNKLNLKLKPTVKAVLDLLVKYSDKEYTCYPSQEYIADKLSVTRETVNRTIKKLEELKYITISKHKETDTQKFFNNIYYINILADSKKGSLKKVKDTLKSKFKEIEKKLFDTLGEIKGNSIDDFYDIEGENLDFNINTFIDDLIDKTGLKKINVLSTIVNIQEQMRTDHIYHIKNYINKSFANASKEEKIKDVFHFIHKKLPGDLKEKLLLIS